MNQKIRGFFKNQWVVGAFYFLLSMIPVTIFWKSIIYYFGSLICSLLTKTEVSVYILILLPILGIFLTIVFFWILAILNKRVETQHPKYQEYTEDIIDGKLYRWFYLNDSSSPTIIGLFCQHCNCQIINNRCPECNTFFSPPTKCTDELRAIIHSRIERKYFGTK